MRLYHGSNTEIETIDLSRGRQGKDFGSGFYTSADYMQAVEFTSNVIRREGKGIPTVTSFEFDESAFEKLNVKRFEGYTKEWAEFILANRQNDTGRPIHSYDIVIGPMADENIYSYISDFINGIISREKFWKLIKYGCPTHQIVFCTNEALNCAKFIDYREII